MKPKTDTVALADGGTAPVEAVDRTFNRIVLVSTAMGFAAVLGSAACLERGADGGLTFRWHWRALIWMALGVVVAMRLWRLLWRAQSDGTGKAASQLKRFCAGLLIGAVGVFVYPILFVSSEHFDDVLTGLSLATAVLTFVGWMIYRVIKGLNASDAMNEGDLKIKN
jgi:hypothetical protein